ncbi:MAG: PTS system glucose-specific EIICB component [Eubacteriales bacterium]|jgi:N-acetylglucosamine PTS system EIICBA or EIICB component
MQKVLAAFQKLGKSLMLPIAVLPVAGLFLRFGQPDLLNIPFIQNSGGILFDNLPMLFAIGIAVGLAKDNHGAAGLAGAICYYILTESSQAVNYALQVHTIFLPEGGLPEDLTKINMAVFGGIIAGIIAGLLYNRFKDTKLPDWLGFFGGRRFVPIVSGGASLAVGAVLGVIWPTIQKGLDAAANWMLTSKGPGEFIYGFLNRLLIPVGLHHVINTPIWFQFGDFTKPDGTVVHGDINRFLAGDPTGGHFTAGFFPIMMFALPAAALAMYVCAKKENKTAVGGALFSVALTAFLTGITEPIEFMFMFLAPVLYLIHAVLMGVSLVVCSMLGIHDSFAFSAGLTDYLLNWNIARNGWMIIPVGLVFAVIYFFLFVFFIKKFNLKTPGREDDNETADFAKLVADQGFDNLAKQYIEALGGAENIKEIDSCITRIRLVLQSNKELDETAFKSLGASGLLKAGNQVTQVIVGTKAEMLVNAMKKFLA